MPYLTDSDDSDNEFLNEAPAFAKPSEPVKRVKTSLQTLKQLALGKPITKSEETTRQSKAVKKRKRGTHKKPVKKAKPSKQELLRAERQNDPTWIEEQARKTVNEVLRLDVVDNITDLNEIGWCRYPSKKGKKADFYPAIISQNKAEAEILLHNPGKKKNYKTLRIQYIGVGWNDALKHEEIALSKWIPYTSGNESENQERLQNFIKTISKTSRFKNNHLELMV